MAPEAQLRGRLLWRIGRRYRTVTQTLELPSLRLQFTRIADPDTVLDQVAADVDLQERLHGRAAAQEHLHLPYWAELWDSAMGVGQFLAEKGSGFRVRGSGEDDTRMEGTKRQRDKGTKGVGSASADVSTQSSVLSLQSSASSVLDLGCGMGLAGTVAAAMGGRVLFADIEPPALLFARLNSLPWRGRVRTRRLDWQRDQLSERFGLILGADILYEKAQWPFLERFWRNHLEPWGTVLLGEPGRATGEDFIPWIADRGWAMEQFQQPVSTRPKPIRLFSLRPPAM